MIPSVGFEQASAFETGQFPRPRLVFCERFDETSTIWNLQRHQHDFVELLYFFDGEALIHGPGQDVKLSVYDVVVYPEGCVHKEDIDLTRHQEIVCLGIALSRPSGLQRIVRLPDFDNRLRWLFIEIHRISNSRYSGRNEAQFHLVVALLHYLRNAMLQGLDDADAIERVVRYVRRNFERHINAEELSEIANCSVSYLSRQFKRRAGMTPMSFLEETRMDAAARLLTRGDLDVSQVADLVGFEDPKYFSRRFSRRFGVAPIQYKQHRSQSR
jgi:AraC-like DNA-binding protein